jgi:Ca2+/Na+ antiporter
MSELGFKNEDGKEKILAVNKEKNPFSNKFVKIFFGGWLIIFLGFVALTIISFVVEYLANGNVGEGIRAYYILFGAAAIIGTFLFYALVIYIFVYYVIYIIRSMKQNRSTLQRDEEKPTQVIGEVPAKNLNNKITAYLVVAIGLVVFIAFLINFIRLYFEL